MKRVSIIGLGLIGGSLALAIRKGQPNIVITGYDKDPSTMKLAKSLQVIDEPAASAADAALNSDVIILATPVATALSLIDELADLPLKEGVIVTDVGSTKQSIVKKAKKLTDLGIVFIGGHPMAGSHKTGVEASNDRLFENAFYVLSPNGQQNDSERIKLQNLLKGTRAKFIELPAEEHDRFAGLISHLPHMIASGLVHQLAEEESHHPIVSQLAAGGFRDLTRIASASPDMWRDILMHNRDILMKLLHDWKEQVHVMEEMLKEGDPESIHQFFAKAKEARDQLPARKKGAMLPFYDLFVDVPDHPGVISDVTAILARAGISITNIQIIEARNDMLGVLRLSFRSGEDLELAQAKLAEHLYDTYEAP